MIYHIVVGDEAAKPLQEAITTEPGMAGEIVVMKDILHIGPLQKAEGQSFSELRSEFWNQVVLNEKTPIVVTDMERLLEVSATMYKDEDVKVWLWMAPWAADVCAYHWTIMYLSKHLSRFYVLNLANLPFLNEQGKVFYPKNISEILPKELIKARKLARLVTPAEVEIDGDEWKTLVAENTGIRTHEGGKKLVSRDVTHYDKELVSFCSHQYQKASRIVSQALNKFNVPTGDLFLGWRLRELAAAGELSLQGDTTKMLKDFELKLPGEAPLTSLAATVADEAE